MRGCDDDDEVMSYHIYPPSRNLVMMDCSTSSRPRDTFLEALRTSPRISSSANVTSPRIIPIRRSTYLDNTSRPHQHRTRAHRKLTHLHRPQRPRHAGGLRRTRREPRVYPHESIPTNSFTASQLQPERSTRHVLFSASQPPPNEPHIDPPSLQTPDSSPQPPSSPPSRNKEKSNDAGKDPLSPPAYAPPHPHPRLVSHLLRPPLPNAQTHDVHDLPPSPTRFLPCRSPCLLLALFAFWCRLDYASALVPWQSGLEDIGRVGS